MQFSVRLFMLIIQVIALANTVAAIYIIGVKKIDGVGDNGKGEPVFFAGQLAYCKWATFILLAIGWLFGESDKIKQFAAVCMTIGISWGVLGAIFMFTLIYCLFTKASKPVRDYLRKFSTGSLTFGIFITVLSWLLWG